MLFGCKVGVGGCAEGEGGGEEEEEEGEGGGGVAWLAVLTSASEH